MPSSGFQVLFSPCRWLRSRLDMHGSAWEGRTKTVLVVTEKKGVFEVLCFQFLRGVLKFPHASPLGQEGYVQRDKDGCQLSLQSVPAASLAQKPGGVRSESPCVS